MNNFENRDMYLEIGFNIAFYRKKRGFTQESLCERADISRSHLSAIEAPNLVQGISIDTLFNIARALEIDPYKLLMVRD